MAKINFGLIGFIALVLTIDRLAYADGGTIQSRRAAGAFVITVFTSPAPLQTGPVDLSVMVQDKDTLRPLLDAGVDIRLVSPSRSEFVARATRENARNKLFYASPLFLTESGQWEFTVNVSARDSTATVEGAFQTLAAQLPQTVPPGYFAFPPVVIVIFLLREFLIRRKSEVIGK